MTPALPKIRFYLKPTARAAGSEFHEPRAGDAGFDLRASENILLRSGQQMLIPTGLHLEIPSGWVGLVKDRSSMAVKRVYTHAGVIDASYRGEVKVVLSNHGDTNFQIERGFKIAQLVVVPFLPSAEEVANESDLGSTDRGAGGFGSTGA